MFALWQPRYAEVGIPTFPVKGKQPGVRNYLKIGLRASAALVEKFPSSNAFGLALGARTGITVLDIDTSDEAVLEEALACYGATPFIVRTGSGHYQAWYRYNGEGRLIRPSAEGPIDVLGGGFVVAPPSRTGQGYDLICGSLHDLFALPIIRRLTRAKTRPPGGLVTEGSRNGYLFRFALQHARHSDDEATLLDVVQTENANKCVPPLATDEVCRVVKSAWGYQVEGRNFVATKGTFASRSEVRDLGQCSPHALALLMILRSIHRKGERFALAQAMAAALGWTIRRFRKARSDLETRGLIQCLHVGGRGRHDPPMYELG
jgi:hypothetical protein